MTAKWRRVAVAALGAVAVVLAGGGLAAFVQPGLPAPTGPAPVGTVRMDLPAVPGGRPLVMVIWYPAAAVPGLQRALYREDARLISRQRLIGTHAWRDAPVAPGRHNVVLNAHGWGGFAEDNTALMEDLASHGFVGVAVGAPGGFGTTRTPDGRELDLNGPLDISTDATAATTMAIGSVNTETRAADLLRALDTMAALDANDPSGRFTGHLRTDRVGVVGFSFGGAVAASAARLDRRIAAVINLDGWLFGPAQEEGVAVPYLVFSDDTPLPDPADIHSPDPAQRNWAVLMGRDWDLMRRSFERHGGDYLTLRGAAHADFSDESLVSWQPRRPGKIAPLRATEIERAYALAFFGHWLRGEEPGVLAGTGSPFPEIRRETWPRPKPPETATPSAQ